MNKAVIIILIVLIVAGGALGIMFAMGVFNDSPDGPGTENPGNTETPEACDHEWELLMEKKAECLVDGYRKLVCSICQAEETQTLPASGHNFRVTKAVAPTCFSEGRTELKKCRNTTSGCTYSEGGETIPMLAHTWVNTPAKAPTCTENGCTEGGQHCSVCLTINEDCKPGIIEALGHNPENIDVIEPTCASEGYVGGSICSREGCGQIISLPDEIIPKLEEHSAELVAVSPATCSVDGYSECPVCKARVATEFKSPDKHQWVIEVAAVPADCKTQTDGTAAIYKCSAPGCGATVGGQTIEWETLHTDAENMGWETITEATTEHAGERVGTCQICHVVIREDIPVISNGDFEDDNNIYPDDLVGTPPTNKEDDAA